MYLSTKLVVYLESVCIINKILGICILKCACEEMFINTRFVDCFLNLHDPCYFEFV